MRIRRIKLSNFEGVAASEVSLASTGMTIIEGPNEVGKSSLVRGVDLLFQFPHESRHARVLAACPVHADAGPEVEVELTTGEYHLVYSKRWHKKPETSLTILAPIHGSLAGREAHDRVKAILDETLDDTLYQALRYIQGTQIGQGAVGSSTTLIGALDRAAAGGSADPDAESTLWDAVESERLRYVTPSGRPAPEREQVRTSLGKAEETVSAIDRSIAEIESIGESYRHTLDSLETNRTSRAEALAELGAARQAESEIAEFEATVAPLAARAETAKLKEGEAQRASDERSGLIESIEEAEADCRTLAEAQARAEGETGRAQESLDAANRNLVSAEAERDVAAVQLRLATEDLGYYRSVNSDRLYTSRLNGLTEARDLEATATGVLNSSEVTTAARRVVEGAWSQLRDAQIALEVGSPTVTITALGQVEIGVDNTTVDLAPGDVHALTVTGSTVVSVPEHISLTVTGGASGDDLRSRVDEARRKLSEVIERYGLDPKDPVADLTDQLGRRSQAERDLKHAERMRADALVDLSEAELAAKAASARAIVTEYPSTRGGEGLLPPSADLAEEAFARAENRAEAAEGTLSDARHIVETAQAAVGEARTAEATTKEELRGKTVSLQAAKGRLADSRALSSDADLADRLSASRTSAREAIATQVRAKEELEAKDPGSARLRLTNAEALVQRLEDEGRTIGEERIRLRTLLEKGGADDLQPQRDEAANLKVELRRRHEELEQRTEAAVLLYDTFLRHRDTAKLAYVAPYREQIEALARLVFGQDVRIDVDPADLSIVSRTLGGRTIPFDSLSTGTKEQLAVLARLACAILVNPDGDDADAGVPVILDDALGNTDPARLRALAPAFSDAATRTQVIALASNPDRYGSVGNATVLRLV
jgi:hypothetical protein